MEEEFWMHPNECAHIASTQHADMLIDAQRNSAYRSAIRAAVALALRDAPTDAPPLVLDIGTGTGLLSVLAAQAGAPRVYACEKNQVVASLAEQVVKDNGVGDKIFIVPKYSSELLVGPSGDIPQKASLVIHEIVDSEFIGEGILPTLSHAISHLLTPNFLSVPSSATVYATLIEAPHLWDFHSLYEFKQKTGITLIESPCGGTQLHWQIAIDQIPSSLWKPLSEPFKVFEWDLTVQNPLKKTVVNSVQITKSGSVHGILLWWEMFLDPEKKHRLHTTPLLLDPINSWRLHWQQCLFFLQKPLEVSPGGLVQVGCTHNHIRMWFEVTPQDNNQPKNSSSPPLDLSVPNCHCDLHKLWDRPRIAMLNDFERHSSYEKSIKKALEDLSGKPWINLGDGAITSLIAAKYAPNGHALEKNSVWRNIAKNQAKLNGLQDNISFLRNFTELQSMEQFELVIAEPFYESGQRNHEWIQLLNFWDEKSQLDKIRGKIEKSIPSVASIWGMAVQFKHLPKTLHKVDLSDIDVNIEALNTVLSCVKPMFVHSLWEFEWEPLTEPFDLLTFDFSQTAYYEAEIKNIPFTASGLCHAVVLWVNYQLDPETVIDATPTPGSSPTWHTHSVYTLEQIDSVTPQQSLHISANFDEFDNEIKFNFSVSGEED